MIDRLALLSRSSGKLLEWVVLGSVIVCGDLLTQKIEHNNKSSVKPLKQGEKGASDCSHFQNHIFEIDYTRLKGVAITGFGFLAPLALVWYPFLHRFMATKFRHLAEGSARYVMTKVALENIFLPAPVCLGYFAIPAMVEGGHQWESLQHRLRTDFVPSVAADTAFWCVISPINYKYIAIKYQPLFSCIVDGLEAAGMSYLTHQDEFKWPSW
jgi:hypothetical protein